MTTPVIITPAGVSYLLRKVGNNITTYEDIKQDGDTWQLHITSTFRSSHLKFKLGVQFDEVTMDGRAVKVGSLLTEGRKEMFYLTTLSTHFYLRLYGVRHMVKDYSFRLAARVLLYAPSHRQDSTYHDLCYTSCGALAGTRNCSMGPPHEGSIRRPIAP